MSGPRTFCLMLVAACLCPDGVRAQSAPVVTVDDFLSIGDLMAAVSIQAPPDVNQRPTCEQLALPCLTPRTFGDGGLAWSAAVNAGGRIGIVGEISGYWNHWSAYDPTCDPRHSTCVSQKVNHVRACAGGLRIRTPPIHDGFNRGRLFAQVLAGPQWSDVGPRRTILQPGVGLEGYLQSGVIIRFEFDYRFAPDDMRDLSTGRSLLGIAIPLGLR